GDPLPVIVGVGVVAAHTAIAVEGDDVLGTLALQQTDDRRSGSTDAGDHDLGVGEVLTNDFEGVDQGCQHHDGRAVLVIVEDRDVQLLTQPALHLEAARGGDVFQVDAAIGRSDGLDRAYQLVGVGGVQRYRPGIHAAELLEQGGLALHHRHG